MNDQQYVRRILLYEEGDYDDGYFDDPSGTHALVSWDYWESILAENDRLGWQSKALIDLIMDTDGGADHVDLTNSKILDDDE
jgi:hypothetical protein